MYSLVGVGGNAFAIIGYITRIMRRNHLPKERINDYVNKAMSGDYDNVIQQSLEIVDELNALNPDADDEEDY